LTYRSTESGEESIRGNSKEKRKKEGEREERR